MKKLYFFLMIAIMGVLGFKGIAQTDAPQAKVTISGQFYTFTAQDADDNRNEAFAFTYGTYDNETVDFTFDPEVTYTLKGQNESNSIYVYINGVQVANEAEEGENMFRANVKFNDGDVVEIYETTPYVASVTINGQFYTFAAQDADEPRNEAFAFTYNTYDNESQEFEFSPATTYTLKGQNEANSIYVYINGVEVANEAGEGETGYVANVKFQAGDQVVISDEPVGEVKAATVSINGQFYTFAAQDANDNRNEAFSFAYGTYDNETVEFTFDPSVTYTLKGQNESNSIYVYINGVQIANEADADMNMYQANVKFNEGDVVEIYETTPYVASVTINGQFYTFAAQDADEPRNEAFAFTYATYDNEIQEFEFSPATTYTLKGQNEANSFYVYINGVLVANEVEEDQSGYEANVKFSAGDVVEIYDHTPYVATATINGQFYTFAAQDADEPRNEAFAFTYNTYDNETVEFTFSPATTYTLKGQNEADAIYVYINGVEVANEAEEGQSGYVANVKFQAGDEVVISSTPVVAAPTATVTINGQFYTFAAQDVDDNRNEAFAFVYGTYDNETVEFAFDPEVTYTLKGQNESNSIYVYINGVQVANEADADMNMYQANVKFNEGDVVEIYENTPYVANVTIDGQFYTFAAQDADEPRNEAFAFTYATYDNETQEFEFSPATTYTLKGQNEANIFYVYINGVEVANEAEEGQTGFVANVKFSAGDVVEIYETTPYVATATINGQFYTFVAQNADNTRDEAFDFTYDTYDHMTKAFTFSPAVTYTLKGQNELNSFFVYINGVQVANEAQDGETGFVANVTFQPGDEIEIYEHTPYVASVTIDGQFYTFVAQNPDNTRDEAFDFTYNTYDNEKQYFLFSPGVTYTLKGQNEANSFYVYINGVQVANEAQEGETGYVANVQFHNGDVVEIYENTPYVATVKIDGQFYTFVAQGEDDNRNEAFDFTYSDYDNATEDFTFSPALTYTLKGQNESNTFYVYINGIEIANEAEEGQSGYVANVKFQAGDYVEIYDHKPTTGIHSVGTDMLNGGKVYDLNGIEMKGDNLAPGIYIINGQKVYKH